MLQQQGYHLGIMTFLRASTTLGLKVDFDLFMLQQQIYHLGIMTFLKGRIEWSKTILSLEVDIDLLML